MRSNNILFAFLLLILSGVIAVTLVFGVNTTGQVQEQQITFNDDVDNDNDVIISSDNNGINILSKSELKSVTVYDIAGHLINECRDINEVSKQIHLPVGVYVVEVRTENGVSNNKVIVK